MKKTIKIAMAAFMIIMLVMFVMLLFNSSFAKAVTQQELSDAKSLIDSKADCKFSCLEYYSKIQVSALIRRDSAQNPESAFSISKRPIPLRALRILKIKSVFSHPSHHCQHIR